MLEVTGAQATKLRAPFPPEAIGKLPKLSCKDCSDSAAKVCDKHSKSRCDVCGNFISTAHIHLDYVGHAATTDRLLQVDPDWTWRPMAVGPNGEPLIVNGGLWIELTVCGVTRPGFGDGKNPKEIIGDAIRNAAMRFGVALDLWAKEDLHASAGEPSADTMPPVEDTSMSSGSVAQAGEDEPASPAEHIHAAARKARGDQPPVNMDEIPFGDAPAHEHQPHNPASVNQKKKLDVLVKGGEHPPELRRVYATVGRMRKVKTDALIEAVGGMDSDEVLHWSPLRDSLSFGEAHELIDKLERAGAA